MVQSAGFCFGDYMEWNVGKVEEQVEGLSYGLSLNPKP